MWNCNTWVVFKMWWHRKSNQSILKEISPGISLEGMMLKLKLQYFGHLMWTVDSLEKTLMLGGVGGRRRRGQQRISLTRWTWVWLNSGSRWWTGRPGVLRFMGSQRGGHDWATEMNEHRKGWILPMAEQTLIHSASLRRSLYCFPRSHCTAFVSSFALSWWLFLWISAKFPHFLMPLPTSPLPTEGSSGHPPQLPQVPFFDLFFSLHFSWSNTCLFKYFSRLVSVSLFDVSSRRAGIFVDIVHCRISGILGSVSQVIGT